MIFRVIWCGSLFVLALCVSAAQIDRQARFDPEYAMLVPKPFRGFSQLHVARMAMAGDDAQIAHDQTRQLVRVRPLPAAHLTALALAASANGDGEMALRALESAASRGWREPMSQMAVVEASLLDGNYDQAAQRLVALWSVDGRRERLGSLTARMFESPEGRAAFAQVMPDTERWQRNFASQAKLDVEAEVLEQVLQLAQGNSEN